MFVGRVPRGCLSSAGEADAEGLFAVLFVQREFELAQVVLQAGHESIADRSASAARGGELRVETIQRRSCRCMSGCCIEGPMVGPCRRSQRCGCSEIGLHGRCASDVAGVGDPHRRLPVDGDLGRLWTSCDDHVEFIGRSECTGSLEPGRSVVRGSFPCVSGPFGVDVESGALALQRLLLAVEQIDRVASQFELVDQVEPGSAAA